MNNSKLAQDFADTLTEELPVDILPKLKEREAELIKIIEAIQGVKQTPAWSTLKSQIFDGVVTRFENELKDEAIRETPDTNKLNRISGQLTWAKRYADLDKLESVYRTELLGLRKQIYG
jgi:hypothetical protein